MPKELDKEVVYTKTEVDRLIAEAKYEAIEEARKIDEASMRKHNWTATIISMILGLIALALFLDGLLRILGIIPPFMEMIDTSWSSIRIALILVMGVIWFYLLNVELRSGDDDQDN
jgi:hypothetical protein